eukprot:scaffold1130_cov195-Pinguiococcus_pyrenoidosus.AAC.5
MDLLHDGGRERIFQLVLVRAVAAHDAAQETAREPFRGGARRGEVFDARSRAALSIVRGRRRVAKAQVRYVIGLLRAFWLPLGKDSRKLKLRYVGCDSRELEEVGGGMASVV